MIVSRSAKYSIFVLLLFALIGLAVLAWAFFTERGSHFTLNRIQSSLNDVEYEYASGNLATGLSLKNLSWRLKNNTTINSNELIMQWDPWCWRGRQICLKQAHSQEISINLVRPKVIRNPVKLKSVSTSTEIQIGQLNVGRLVINRPDRPSIEISNIDFEGNFNGTKVTADRLTAQWLKLSAELSGQIALEGNYPLTATGKFNIDHAAKQTASGDISLSGDLLNTTVDAVVKLPFESHVNGTVSPINRLFPVDLTATWSNGVLPFQSESPVVSIKQSKVKITGFKPDYNVAASGMVTTAELPDSAFTMTGNINRERLKIADLDVSSFDGNISVTGDVKFPDKQYKGFKWNTDVVVDGIEPARHTALPVNNLSGLLQVVGQHYNGMTRLELLDMNLSGQSHSYPFSLSGSAIRDMNAAWQLSNIAIVSNRNTVSANGMLSAQSDLSLAFAMQQPAMFHPDVQGDLSGNFKITGDSHMPNISGVAHSSLLTYKNLRATNAKLDLRLLSAGHKPGQLTITADALSQADRAVRDITLSVNGERNSHFATMESAGDIFRINKSRLTGSFDQHWNWKGKLLGVYGDTGGSPFHLLNAFELAWTKDNRSMSLKPHCWALGGAFGCINRPATFGKDGAISFSLKGLDLADLNALYQGKTQTQGSLKSNGEFRWTSFGNPVVNLTADVNDGSFTTLLPLAKHPLNVTIESANLKIYTRGKEIRSRLKLISDKTGEVTASAMVDFNKPNQPIEGALQLQGIRLDQLKEYYPDFELDNGTLSTNLFIGGTLGKPLVSGKLNVNNVDYVSDKLPLPLNAINIEADIAQNDINLTGTAQSNGRTISISGLAKPNDLAENSGWLARLRLKGKHLRFTHKYAKSGVISPDVTMTMTPEGTTLTGDVALNDAFIEIPRLENSAVDISRDVVIIDAASSDKTPQNTPLSQTITTDFNLRLGREVYFSGYGLNAQLEGQTNIKITPQRTPELLGVLNVKSGTYRSYGQALNIREGRISFVGPIEQTALSVEAIRDTGPVVAGIRIEGTLDNPNTTLFSDPPMPEEHILPYVVLGRPLELGTNANDPQLLANAALFMGVTGGRSITKDIAANLGIDNFYMNTIGTGKDTQVQLSGRINDRLLVRYGLGVFKSVNTLFLRYDLAEKLYLETTQGLERAVDVFYTFEFD